MLNVENISFAYTKTKVLKDVSFKLKKGEHLSVIGESGSGKSTLLKLLYGEHDLDLGHIYWNNQEVLGPKHNLVVGYDAIKYVSQEFDLMPFTSVEENVGKFLSNFFPEEKKERVNDLLAVVELTAFRNSKVKSLSGGQKQRVALARAIAKQPELILLDEPFSHIDNFKKQMLRRSLFRYLKDNDITCVVATHDKNDVLGYADKMIVLNNHIIEANDSPENLFKNPKSPLVASFFDEFNVINNRIYYANELKVVKTSNMRATVKKSYFKGSYYLIEADLDGQALFIEHSAFLEATTPISIELKNS
jgi:ABC-type Fe3+/spermidine/putrescine transport system ATPase subunit